MRHTSLGERDRITISDKRGYLSSNVRYKVLVTKSKNYGTYDDRQKLIKSEKIYQFYNGLDQNSALFQFDFINFLRRADLQFSYAIDRGDLFKNSDGFQLSINYTFSNLSYSQWYNKCLKLIIYNESKYKP